MKLIEKRIIHLEKKSLNLEIKMKARYDELVDFVSKNELTPQQSFNKIKKYKKENNKDFDKYVKTIILKYNLIQKLH